MAPITCSVCAIQSLLVIFNSSWISAYTYDNIIDTVWIMDKKLLHFKLLKSGQILRVDKTSFPALITFTIIFRIHYACKWIKIQI